MRRLRVPIRASLTLWQVAVFALIFGGIYLLVKKRERQKGLLMLLLAVVIFGNVVIWTL